jgi:peptidyl-prolyl cis-trans isomerase B (cyclophilin B)
MVLVLVAVACDGELTGGESPSPAAPFTWPTGPHPSVVLEIEKYGPITVELYPELAPRTVQSFLDLVNSGFYDGTSFHRVITDFMIQGGDPNSRDLDPANDGEGGPGFSLADEFSAAPHLRGVLSLANSGQPDTGGSQFFILQRDSNHLDGRHSVFGRVVEGLDVVDRIAAAETDLYGRWGKANRPLEKIVIGRASVVSGPDPAR